ncbi:hypothetical protein V6N12_046516 [Hibiscus sabdariffa]|uniref:RNase H type-1 domain-containing protein n=1 Tax=Hibiscus sabdariffa TaxID=183260 RepID=A0ABR2DIV6_9ROSI
MLFKNEQGELLQVASQLFTAISAFVAEAIAIRVCLLVALEVSFANIIVESDNLNVMRHVNAKAKAFSAWESSVIERDICNLSSLFHSISFSVINRSCNQVVDWETNTVHKGIRPLELVVYVLLN